MPILPSPYRLLLPLAALLTVGWSAPAHADPCQGKLPAKGAAFSGVVRYVGDGDSLCVGPAGQPDRWIEVRLGDFFAPELRDAGGADAKRRLGRIALGQPLTCRAGKHSHDRVVGYCALKGQPLGALLLRNGAVQGGRGWRQ